MKNIARNTLTLRILLISVKILGQERRILFDDAILASVDKNRSIKISKERYQDCRVARLIQRKLWIGFMGIIMLYELQLDRRYKIDTILTYC